ncbi:MAG: ribonuclease [Rickettsiaceae bacterium]|jgi:ribonuclease HI|nr:ribonuclease [Rickettsiaceae bacterium]
MNTRKHVVIYTDGACAGNPGPGGWGVYLIFGKHEKKIYGSSPDTTNNRMELTAAIEALKALKEPCDIDLYTDSKYVKDGITDWIVKWRKNNWRKSDKDLVKNSDLWQTLDDALKNHNITWHWVKGHSDNKGNIIADSLAVKGCQEAKKMNI